MNESNIPIWTKEVPGNNKKSKLEELNIGKRLPEVFLMTKAAIAMRGTEIQDADAAKRGLDSYQYYHEIASGFRSKKFEDVPALDYYPCKGSDKAVLVIPGGGFTYQSNSGIEIKKQSEGGAVALRLNSAGFSVFVLSVYRLNPYRMPVPLLDAQRAYRYIVFHASSYGIDPNKLGIVGFSAGGYIAGAIVNIVRNQSPTEVMENANMHIRYSEDEIDAVQVRPAFAGLIYPMLGFNSNVPMMYAAFAKDDINNPQTRKKLLQEYDLVQYVREGDCPQFIAMGSKDNMVDLTDDKTRYMNALRAYDVPFTYLNVSGAGHGFGATNKKYSYWMDKFSTWVSDLSEITR